MQSNGKQNIPPLFEEIITNEEKLWEVLTHYVIPFDTASSLIQRKRELMRAAEKALKWNTDKGSTA